MPSTFAWLHRLQAQFAADQSGCPTWRGCVCQHTVDHRQLFQSDMRTHIHTTSSGFKADPGRVGKAERAAESATANGPTNSPEPSSLAQISVAVGAVPWQ